MSHKKKHNAPPPPPPMQQSLFPGMPPGMMPPNTGGRPMVVVMMKGGGQPNLGGLPFMMGGPPPPQPAPKKRKKKSKGGKKKTKKSGEKKTKKSGEEDSDSESDRVHAPDMPAAHTHKPPPTGTTPPPSSAPSDAMSRGRGNKNGGGVKGGTPANPMASSFGSTDGGGGGGGGGGPAPSSSTTSTTSAAVPPMTGGPPTPTGAVKKIPAKKPPVKKAPAKPGIKKEAFIVKDGNVDKSCVPAFVLVDGPAGCPIVVPIDARDENAIVNELGPQPLTVAPKETTKGYLVLNEEGLLYFKHHKECKEAPFASTPGQLQKFLANSNIFIADAGPQLPDEKAYNKASTATKDKIGGKDIAVSGTITMVTDKGTCKFTRVVITQPFPFYGHNAAFGVLVRDFDNGYVYFVPTENRFVGMVLSQGVKQPFKPVVEAQVVGNIYKGANGAATWEVPSDKKENQMGYIISSGTGVPIYVPKPDDNIQRAATPVKKAPGKGVAVTPPPVSVTGQTASPSPASPGTAVDGTALSTTVPIAAPTTGQPGETGGAVKAVESVTLVPGGGGVTSTTVPLTTPTETAGSEGGTAATGGEAMSPQDHLKKMVAAQQELPPVPEQPAEAAPAAKEEEKEEEQEAPPPPPPKKPAPTTEYKKFLDDRSAYM